MKADPPIAKTDSKPTPKLAPLPNPNLKTPVQPAVPPIPAIPTQEMPPDSSSLRPKGHSIKRPPQNEASNVNQIIQHLYRASNRRPSSIIVVVIIIAAVAFSLFGRLSHPFNSPPKTDYTNQELSASQLSLLNSATSADPNRTLTINSNSIFNGNILVSKDINTTGRLTTGPLAASNFNASGVATLQGGLNVSNFLNLSGNLSVTGNGSFAGDVTANSFTVRTLSSGNLNISGHLITSGAAPNTSGGQGLGGGRVQIVGNDNAGTVIIETGGSPLAGTLATLTFRTPFGNYPKVAITPVGGNAAVLSAFTTRTPNLFTINSVAKPAPNTEYVFDYIVAQ